MNLLQLLLGSLASNDSVNSVSKKTGVSSKLTSKLLLLAIPLLLKQLTKNASNKDGAQSLLGALTQHTSKETVANQVAKADTVDGAKIIGHIFGSNQNAIINSLAKESGATTQEVNSILNTIAPALLNSLGTATNSLSNKKASGKIDLSDGLDLSDLVAVISGNTNVSSVLDLASSLARPQQSNGLASLLAGNKKQDDSTELLSSLLSLMK